MEKNSSKVGGGPGAGGEGREKTPQSRRLWRLTAVVGAVSAILLATAISSRSFPMLWISSNSCKCPVGESVKPSFPD